MFTIFARWVVSVLEYILSIWISYLIARDDVTLNARYVYILKFRPSCYCRGCSSVVERSLRIGADAQVRVCERPGVRLPVSPLFFLFLFFFSENPFLYIVDTCFRHLQNFLQERYLKLNVLFFKRCSLKSCWMSRTLLDFKRSIKSYPITINLSLKDK